MARPPIDWTKSFKETTASTSTNTSNNYTKSFRDLVGERLYKPVLDKNSNKSTKTIRFLPPALNEQIARLKVTYHELKDPQDPTKFTHVICNNYSNDYGNMETCEVCKKYFKAKKEKDNYVLKSMKLVTKYLYNILVITDPEVPENNGKVFLFNASKFLDQKVMNYAKPSDPDEESIDVTDYATGKNVKYVLYKKAVPKLDINGQDTGEKFYMNEDNLSEFKDRTPISLGKSPMTEKELDELDKKIYSLDSILSTENLPTKEQIHSAFEYIYGADEAKESPKKSYVESAKVSAPKNTPVEPPNLPEFPEDDDNFEALFNNQK